MGRMVRRNLVTATVGRLVLPFRQTMRSSRDKRSWDSSCRVNPYPTPALQFHGFRTDAHDECGREEGEFPSVSGEVDDAYFFELIPAGQRRLAADGIIQFDPALEGTRKLVCEILHGLRAQLRVHNLVLFSKTDRCRNFRDKTGFVCRITCRPSCQSRT